MTQEVARNSVTGPLLSTATVTGAPYGAGFGEIVTGRLPHGTCPGAEEPRNTRTAMERAGSALLMGTSGRRRNPRRVRGTSNEAPARTPGFPGVAANERLGSPAPSPS